MTWLWDTIAGRTLLVLVAGLALSLGIGQYLYHKGLERELREGNAARLAERLIVLSQTITRVPREQRDEAAHALSGGPIDMHWSAEPLAVSSVNLDPTALRLRDVLREKLPALGERGLLVGTSQGADAPHPGHSHGIDHVTLVSMRVPDGSWVTMSVAQVAQTSIAAPSFLSTAILLALCIAALAALMGRWLTQPLTKVAASARALYAGAQNAPVAEAGTREVRDLAAAFNDMQARIKRLIDDRTNMLAAISHDLRTPLTRLRLRAESLGDETVRASVTRDLNDMEGMLDATLAFLRGDQSDEDVQVLDVSAILQTVVNDCEDAGGKVQLTSTGDLVARGRSLGLKRAFTNLIQNAVRYGDSAQVSANAEADLILVSIEDRGPGIPAEHLESVFTPFKRLDPARGDGQPGYGLGLTIARSLIRLHGGEIALSNRGEGGLRALVTLPKSGQRP